MNEQYNSHVIAWYMNNTMRFVLEKSKLYFIGIDLGSDDYSIYYWYEDGELHFKRVNPYV